MTHSQTSTPYTPTSTSGAEPSQSGTSSTSDVAKDEARNVGQTASQAGSQVAGTAADEAKNVAGEAKAQAGNVISQGRQQVSSHVQEQARTGQQKAAQSLSSLAGELRSMADNSQQSGPATDLVRQATGKVEELSSWLQDREPGDILDEVRGFARRKPGLFLLGAAAAGVLAGRLTTGVVAAHKEDSSSSRGTSRRELQGQENWVEDTYTTPSVAYTTPAYVEGTTPAYVEGQTVPTHTGTGDHVEPTAVVPPAPYATAPEAAGTPAGWDDPERGLGQGGRR